MAVHVLFTFHTVIKGSVSQAAAVSCRCSVITGRKKEEKKHQPPIWQTHTHNLAYSQWLLRNVIHTQQAFGRLSRRRTGPRAALRIRQLNLYSLSIQQQLQFTRTTLSNHKCQIRRPWVNSHVHQKKNCLLISTHRNYFPFHIILKVKKWQFFQQWQYATYDTRF